MKFSLDLDLFFEKGTLFNFNIETTENDVINLCGEPDEIEDYGKKGKYFHYDNLRFLFSHSQLGGIDLFFFNSDFSFKKTVGEDVFIIDKNIELVTILLLLNNYNLKWNIPYEKSLQDYLLLETSSELKIYYYFYNCKIERISRSFN